MILDIIFGLFGGVALLLYGMQTTTESLKKLLGSQIRLLINHLTATRISSLFTGTVLATMMQSSGAAIVMLIGLAETGLLNLGQSIGMILGVNIGATVVVQLIAFRITHYSLFMLGLGFSISYIGRNKIAQNMGSTIMGFGFIFLALQLLGNAILPVREHQELQQLAQVFVREPLVGVIFGALLTAILNSSSAMLGILLAIASQGVISVHSTVPLILGANIGTCIVAIIASFRTQPEARRIALLHFIFKVLGVLMFLPFLKYFGTMLEFSSADIQRQIANGHTFFNLAIALAFLPFTPLFIKLASQLIPAAADVELGFKVRHLDEHVLQYPVIALGHTQREARRMADRVLEMYGHIPRLLLKNDEDAIDRIVKRETEVDQLMKAIVTYISELGQSSLDPEEAKKAASLLYIVNDLEHIGDIVSRITRLGIKKIEKGIMFSTEGIQELTELYNKVKMNLDMAIIAFMTSDPTLANQVLESESKIIRFERDLRQSHLGRLWAGKKVSLDSSSLHLDITNSLQRINDHAVNISQTVLGEL